MYQNKFKYHNHNASMRLFAQGVSAMVLLSLFRLAWMSFSVKTLETDNGGLSGASYQNLNDTRVNICGRKIEFNTTSSSSASTTNDVNKHQVVVIGYDNMHHVKTNNHINAILHAIDYAQDHNSTLAVARSGWATDVLQLLFGKNFADNKEEWERNIECHLNIKIVSQDTAANMIIDSASDYKSVAYMTGDEMYYYHSKSNVSTILERRIPVLQYLWTHAIEKSATGKADRDMCSAISTSLPEKYVVIHSRWMKNGTCLKRLGRLAKRVKKETDIRIDAVAPCMLNPSYIESILRSSNHLDAPIYVISDGLNPNITKALENHPTLNVMTVPDDLSWVGGEYLLFCTRLFLGDSLLYAEN